MVYSDAPDMSQDSCHGSLLARRITRIKSLQHDVMQSTQCSGLRCSLKQMDLHLSSLDHSNTPLRLPVSDILLLHDHTPFGTEGPLQHDLIYPCTCTHHTICKSAIITPHTCHPSFEGLSFEHGELINPPPEDIDLIHIFSHHSQVIYALSSRPASHNSLLFRYGTTL